MSINLDRARVLLDVIDLAKLWPNLMGIHDLAMSELQDMSYECKDKLKEINDEKKAKAQAEAEAKAAEAQKKHDEAEALRVEQEEAAAAAKAKQAEDEKAKAAYQANLNKAPANLDPPPANPAPANPNAEDNGRRI